MFYDYEDYIEPSQAAEIERLTEKLKKDPKSLDIKKKLAELYNELAGRTK